LQVRPHSYMKSMIPLRKYMRLYRAAKAPVEAHILAQGNHGFNMGMRSDLQSVRTWPQRMADWLSDTNILDPSKKKK